MTTDAQRKHDTATYLALGRFVVSFSGVLYALEQSTVHLVLGGPPAHNTILVEAALADRTASPIVSSFFSVFFKRWEGSLTAKDTEIMKCLRRELDDVVKERNRIMHDAWLSKSVGGDPGPHAMSRLRVRAHGGGVEHEITDYPPNKVEGLVDTLNRLASVIWASVWYMRKGQSGPELDTRLEIQERRVVLKRRP
jgi:hypothetical protein